MRCPKSIGKHRMNPHNGRSKGDYNHGMKGHTWKHVPDGTRCQNCGKYLNHHPHEVDA
jgi:rubredoxin